MQELNLNEIESVSGSGLSIIEWATVADAISEIASSFMAGAKAGYGQQ